mmetsp:Transcript_40122/g.95341  ORF Transcript_40122/g.95341 Transcript_40122/m.95341 type:complete len:381 (+) Transcript_40122:1548-2690(+)
MVPRSPWTFATRRHRPGGTSTSSWRRCPREGPSRSPSEASAGATSSSPPASFPPRAASRCTTGRRHRAPRQRRRRTSQGSILSETYALRCGAAERGSRRKTRQASLMVGEAERSPSLNKEWKAAGSFRGSVSRSPMPPSSRSWQARGASTPLRLTGRRSLFAMLSTELSRRCRLTRVIGAAAPSSSSSTQAPTPTSPRCGCWAIPLRREACSASTWIPATTTSTSSPARPRAAPSASPRWNGPLTTTTGGWWPSPRPSCSRSGRLTRRWRVFSAGENLWRGIMLACWSGARQSVRSRSSAESPAAASRWAQAPPTVSLARRPWSSSRVRCTTQSLCGPLPGTPSSGTAWRSTPRATTSTRQPASSSFSSLSSCPRLRWQR